MHEGFVGTCPNYIGLTKSNVDILKCIYIYLNIQLPILYKDR